MYTSNIDETLLTVRLLGACEEMQIQEFARIIFVDDILNHARTPNDQRPLKKRPSYKSVTPKVVCSFTMNKIMHIIKTLSNLF